MLLSPLPVFMNRNFIISPASIYVQSFLTIFCCIFSHLVSFLFRVRQVQTMEELRDVYQHFLLYYGSDLPKMRNSEKKKSKESTESQEGEEQEKKEEDVHDDTIKHASRKNGYTICQKNKLGKLST